LPGLEREGTGAAPVLSDWDVHPDLDMVLGALGTGLGRARGRPSVVGIAEQAVTAGQGLLRPVVVASAYAVTGLRHERLVLEGGGCLAGPLVKERLWGARSVVAAVCTIGPALETEASAWFARDPAIGLALDAFGTAAIDLLVAALCQRVGDWAGAEGLQATMPLSPGLIGWPLATGQGQLFALVDAPAAGVSLTEGFMMVPRKSTSLVVGIGAELDRSGEPCDYCSVAATCRYRQRQAPRHGQTP
jgi:hypothetical protein